MKALSLLSTCLNARLIIVPSADYRRVLLSTSVRRNIAGLFRGYNFTCSRPRRDRIDARFLVKCARVDRLGQHQDRRSGVPPLTAYRGLSLCHAEWSGGLSRAGQFPLWAQIVIDLSADRVVAGSARLPGTTPAIAARRHVQATLPADRGYRDGADRGTTRALGSVRPDTPLTAE